jgi:glutamate dehydrogenase
MDQVLAAGFEDILFGQVAAEDVAGLPAKVRGALAAAALRTLQRREPGSSVVTLSDGGAHGLDGVVILEALNDDRPFLLDSTLEELRERGIAPLLVAHPILAVERAADGTLKTAPTLPADRATGKRESLIHIHLPPIGAAEAADLKAGLGRVYADVALAVEDFTPMRQRLAALIAGYRASPPPAAKDDLEETLAFLEWIVADHMTLLGMREYRLGGNSAAPVAVDGSGLGILRDPSVNVLRRGRNDLVMTPELIAFLREPQILIITKANVKSLVHRRVHMDYVGVKLFDAQGRVSGELRAVGLLTATAYNDPVTTVPHIRRKAQATVARAGFPANSYSARALSNVLETYPRDELFQISQDQLDAFALDILALGDRPRIRALPRVDRFDRFVSLLVYVPKDRYDSTVRRRIGTYLAETYQGRLSAAYPAYLEGPLARTHFIIGRDDGPTPPVARTALEAGIAAIVRTWADDLRAMAVGDPATEALIRRHGERFGAAYREAFGVATAIEDMEIVDRLTPERPRLVNLYRRPGEEPSRASLKVFSLREPVTLSERVPLLEGLGFRVINDLSAGRAGSRGRGLAARHDAGASGGRRNRHRGDRSAHGSRADGAVPRADGVGPAERPRAGSGHRLARGRDASNAVALHAADPRALRAGLRR